MANEACLPFHFGIVKAALWEEQSMFHKISRRKRNFITIPSLWVENTWKYPLMTGSPPINSIRQEVIPGGWAIGRISHIHFDDESPTPASGIIKPYTYDRVYWEMNWIQKKWPGSIDTTRIYMSGSSQGAVEQCFMQ